MLAYNPLQDIPKEKHHLIIGGEVHLWTELTDSMTLDFMLWPRAAAAAEKMWRGIGEVEESTTRRLAVMRERLVKKGIRAGMVQMGVEKSRGMHFVAVRALEKHSATMEPMISRDV